ncbi:MAG: hypothetical protein JWP27_1825, partial [Flaviaesturariibacter sp.]|nr:hypothetical protein [Flaviaesturariibacter sp.]
MKKILFIPALLLAGLLSQAQFTSLSPKAYDATLQSTVLVVLKHSDSLNNKLRGAFDRYWKATPYRFVTTKELEGLQNGKANGRLSVFEGTMVKTINVIS